MQKELKEVHLPTQEVICQGICEYYAIKNYIVHPIDLQEVLAIISLFSNHYVKLFWKGRENFMTAFIEMDVPIL